MKRIRKFLFRFFALAMLAMLVAGSVLGGFGYKMYRDALAEQPLDQKVAEIQADPNYTSRTPERTKWLLSNDPELERQGWKTQRQIH